MNRFTVSTDDLPAELDCHRKARLWGESIADFSGMAVDSPRPDGFSARMAGMAMDGVMVADASATSIRFKRESHQIRYDPRESFMLLINDGRSLLGGRQRGEVVDISHGQALGLAHTLPHVSYAMGGGSALAVTVSHDMLRPHLGTAVEDFGGKAISGDTEPMRLLRSYLRLLLASPPPFEPRLATSVSSHLAELMALALSGGVRHSGLAPAVLGARANAIIERIRRDCGSPDLNAQAVGAALGISIRSVQLALQSVGTTFGDEVRRQRLHKAYAALKDTRQSRSSILEIAEECGFADASTFYRAFKAEFACTPSDVRSGSRRDGP